jgi:preprotein translocase subunit SecD
MQKNLRWKLLMILAIMAVCIFFFVSPREKGAGLLSRLNLGLDLKGGIHLDLRVVTDDALDQEINQDVLRITQELKTKSIPYESAKKGNGFAIDIKGIASSQEKEVRTFLNSAAFSSGKYDIRSSVVDGKTGFNLALTGSFMREAKTSTVNQALETIRRRVDSLGVTEPTLQIYGGSGQEIEDRIIVELPGVDDPDRVKDLTSKTAQLNLKLVKRENGGPFASVEEAWKKNNGQIPEDYEVVLSKDNDQEREEYLIVNKVPVITGKDMKTARRSDDENGSPAVSFYLTSDGGEVFSRATEQNIGERLAIVLDDVVYSAPAIKSQISGDGIITGRFTAQEANDLALLLRSGALPASLEVLSQQSVGASLGNDSIKSGIYASLIGFGLVVIGMVVYYKHSGLNAVWCLIANLIIMMGFMGAMSATLTLPGIAGIILTIGMAVDSNILIFERIREEMRAGKTVRAAIDTGFSKVFWTIFDTHVTTLVSAAFLFQFGTGPIKGFAVTLVVGLLANMFTAIFVSHRLFEWMLGNRKVETLSI